MSLVGQLVLLYAGIVLLDVALAAMLWRQRGGDLNRLLFLVWVTAALGLVAQGLAQGSSLLVTLGFSTVFLVDLALARLLAALAGLEVPWRAYVGALLAALAASAGAAAWQAPFWVVALPTSVAVALPLFHTALRALTEPERHLTTSGKTLAASCFLFCAHNLDFPFLRTREEFAALGFTIALFIVLALSITAPIVVLERVTEERVRVEQMSRLRTRFFANVSHELRTPLTLILAPVERLLEQAERADDRDLLEIVMRNAVRLLRLIDELLDLSRIDAGGLRLNVAPVNLPALAASIRDKAAPTAEARGLSLLVEAPVASKEVFGDAHRIESILTNLVANALDHTPEGGRILVRVTEAGDRVVVGVADTGPGIPEPLLSRVFERFFQADGVERRRGRGSGIGLALAKELAELHGGSLTAESTPGRGTTFTLELPTGEDHFRPDSIERRRSFVPIDGSDRRLRELALTAPVAPDRDGGVESRGEPRPSGDTLVAGRRARVLVVEDEGEMRSFLVRLLEPHHDVVEAADGEAALVVLPAQAPDLVVSDVMMPGRSGVDLCRTLKADRRWRHTPVILLTALTGSEATLEAFAHGADDFVTKPFHPRVLLARIRAQLRLRDLSLQLVAQEKLVTVGNLAAGVAHEVRNPLNAAMNAARALKANRNATGTAPALLDVLIDATQRIEAIVSTLDVHARPAEAGGVRPYDVRQGLNATFALLKHRMGDVAIERRYATDRLVAAPAGPINQVLLNVVDNALRAGARRIVASVTGGPDGAVLVRIEDDGPGVPQPLAERVFDPFFTTRPPGDGSGLGLHLSRQIMRQLGGEIRLTTTAPRGAAFEIQFPAEFPRSGGSDV